MRFEESDVVSDMQDLSDVSLSDVAESLTDGDEETMRRVAPADGTRLLVAASFNSAI